MNNAKMGLLFAVLFCEGAAFGWDYQADGKHALSYMEQTNGLFQVAVVDRETQEYAIYRGVFVEKSGLPHLAPIFRQIPIYALPERRKTETISKEPWMPTQEDMYHYTKPAFPVVERDPGLEVWRQEDGRIVLVSVCWGSFSKWTRWMRKLCPRVWRSMTAYSCESILSWKLKSGRRLSKAGDEHVKKKAIMIMTIEDCKVNSKRRPTVVSNLET